MSMFIFVWVISSFSADIGRLWTLVARILVRESKRAALVGDGDARGVEADIDFIVSTLQKRSTSSALA